MAYIKINHDDLKRPLELIELPSDISEWLKSVHKHINADIIEIVNTQLRDLVLIIDDSGKLHDNWHQHINVIATQLYGYYQDPIVGDCILARRCFEDIIDLTDDDIRRITSYFGSF